MALPHFRYTSIYNLGMIYIKFQHYSNLVENIAYAFLLHKLHKITQDLSQAPNNTSISIYITKFMVRINIEVLHSVS